MIFFSITTPESGFNLVFNPMFQKSSLDGAGEELAEELEGPVLGVVTNRKAFLSLGGRTRPKIKQSRFV